MVLCCSSPSEDSGRQSRYQFYLYGEMYGARQPPPSSVYGSSCCLEGGVDIQGVEVTGALAEAQCVEGIIFLRSRVI